MPWTWVYDPHSGGVKIPERTKQRTKQRIVAYAEQPDAGTYIRLDIRFRKQFCSIDAYREPHVADDFPPPDFPESREEYLERVRNNPFHFRDNMEGLQGFIIRRNAVANPFFIP